jgi:hypothetical protein
MNAKIYLMFRRVRESRDAMEGVMFSKFLAFGPFKATLLHNVEYASDLAADLDVYNS